MTLDEHQMMLTRQAVEREASTVDFRITHVPLDSGAFMIGRGRYGGEPAVFIEPAPKPGVVGQVVDDAELGDALHDGSVVITFGNYECSAVLVRAIGLAFGHDPEKGREKPKRIVGYILSSNYQKSAAVAVNDWGWRAVSPYEFERPDGGIVRTVANVDALRGQRGVTVYRGDRFPGLSNADWERLNRMVDDRHVRLVYPERKQPEPHHFWLGEAA